jgi:hypothetical protein
MFIRSYLLCLRFFGLHVITFTNACVFTSAAIVWLPFVVEGFWALWDNIITAAMVMLLKEVLYISCVLLCGNNALKHKTSLVLVVLW